MPAPPPRPWLSTGMEPRQGGRWLFPCPPRPTPLPASYPAPRRRPGHGPGPASPPSAPLRRTSSRGDTFTTTAPRKPPSPHHAPRLRPGCFATPVTPTVASFFQELSCELPAHSHPREKPPHAPSLPGNPPAPTKRGPPCSPRGPRPTATRPVGTSFRHPLTEADPRITPQRKCQ